MDEAAGAVAGLIERARGYDRAAFAGLYRRTVAPVHRYVSARVGTREEAEEVTQEVYLAALARIDSLRAADEAGLLAWLFQIARHKLADHLRQRYRRPTAPLAAAGECPDPDRRPDELAELAAERAAVRQALAHLTPEQREVIVCKFVCGYSNDQTARLVGKTANAVNQLQHRALARLHRLLGARERVS
jgi:RNA polymerase sigma-70 factor, ECF subfamily